MQWHAAIGSRSLTLNVRISNTSWYEVSALEKMRKLSKFCEAYRQQNIFDQTYFREKENMRYNWMKPWTRGVITGNYTAYLWFYQVCAATKHCILEVFKTQQTWIISISLPSGPGFHSLSSIWFERLLGKRCMLPALTSFVYHTTPTRSTWPLKAPRVQLIWHSMTKSSNITAFSNPCNELSQLLFTTDIFVPMHSWHPNIHYLHISILFLSDNIGK